MGKYGMVWYEVTSISCKNVKIIVETVCVNHVNLSVIMSSKISISNFMWYLREKGRLMVYDRYIELFG